MQFSLPVEILVSSSLHSNYGYEEQKVCGSDDKSEEVNDKPARMMKGVSTFVHSQNFTERLMLNTINWPASIKHRRKSPCNSATQLRTNDLSFIADKTSIFIDYEHVTYNMSCTIHLSREAIISDPPSLSIYLPRCTSRHSIEFRQHSCYATRLQALFINSNTFQHTKSRIVTLHVDPQGLRFLIHTLRLINTAEASHTVICTTVERRCAIILRESHYKYIKLYQLDLL